MNTDPVTVISRHPTNEGVVVWSRCACGRLRMDLLPYDSDGLRLIAGAHDVWCPFCGRPG